MENNREGEARTEYVNFWENSWMPPTNPIRLNAFNRMLGVMPLDAAIRLDIHLYERKDNSKRKVPIFE